MSSSGSAGAFELFLSYPGGSRGDSEHARQLSDLLAAYGFRAFIAERELGTRATPDAIGRWIARVPVFVACVGARRVGRWGMEELRRAAERAERHRDLGLLTVVFPGGDPSALDDLPAIFSSRPVFDLRSGVTSVAPLMPTLWQRLDPPRFELLRAVASAVLDDDGPVVLTGPTGAGKSMLADVVLADLADAFPGGQVSLPVDRTRTPGGMASLILRMLGVDTEDIPRDRRREAYRDFTAAGRYLVVLDDTDGYDVGALVPAAPSAAVIVAQRPPDIVPSQVFDVTPSMWKGRGPGDAGASSPGFASDLPEGEDLLDIEGAVAALCSVVAAREVAPPLSIGLFGDWGMGKSFFIGCMRARIEALASASRGVSDSAFFGDIRQIEFNAWHYADANLWASLATRVFEGLADDPGEKQRIARELVRSGERLVEAETDREAARERVQEAEAAIEQAKQELVNAKVSLREAVAATGDVLGDDARLAATMADLRAVRRLPWTLRVCGGTLLAAALAVAVAAPDRRYAALVALAGVGTLLAGPLRWSARALRLAARWQRAVAARQEAKQIARLQVEVHTRRAHEIDAAHRLEAARRQVAEAERAVEEIRSGRRLFRFIDERADGGAYRPYQGVVDLVRRDFDRLAELIAGSDPDAPGDLPRIERIVLYVDDLDRCPARRVIEVLEAVHLLLASNLFVVVVAVDPRWLMRALEQHYGAEMAARDGRRGATTRDYLEKIFQIPFALPRMDEAGFGRLVGDLLPVDAPVAGVRTRIGAVVPDGRPVGTSERPLALGDASEREPPMPARRSVPIDVRPEGLRIHAAERDFMQRLVGLIETPRAAKRLTNVYRLLRVSLDARDLAALLGRDRAAPEYPCVQLLLSIVVGVPSLSPAVLSRLSASAPDASWWTLIDDPLLDAEDAHAVERLRSGTHHLRVESLPPLARFAAWVPHVRRYTYGIG